MPDIVARARALADDLLFPGAGGIDATGAVPTAVLDALAAEGLYGLVGPVTHGGLGASGPVVHAVTEALAGGDLSATFIWLQHLTVPAMVAGSPLADAWLADLCAGRVRAGIALLAATRPQPVAITARREGDRFVLDGGVPWVTGWDHVDVVLVAARDEHDVVHFLLVDAVAGPTLEAVPQQLVAVQASSTVELRVHGHEVPAARLVRSVPLAEWQAADPATCAPTARWPSAWPSGAPVGRPARAGRRPSTPPGPGWTPPGRPGCPTRGPRRRPSRTAPRACSRCRSAAGRCRAGTRPSG